MQWMVGNVNATTGLKGVGDLFNKAIRGSVTGESAIKPEYTGDGTLVLEPTYKHILLIDLKDWNNNIVLDAFELESDGTPKYKEANNEFATFCEKAGQLNPEQFASVMQVVDTFLSTKG